MNQPVFPGENDFAAATTEAAYVQALSDLQVFANLNVNATSKRWSKKFPDSAPGRTTVYRIFREGRLPTTTQQLRELLTVLVAAYEDRSPIQQATVERYLRPGLVLLQQRAPARRASTPPPVPLVTPDVDLDAFTSPPETTRAPRGPREAPRTTPIFATPDDLPSPEQDPPATPADASPEAPHAPPTSQKATLIETWFSPEPTEHAPQWPVEEPRASPIAPVIPVPVGSQAEDGGPRWPTDEPPESPATPPSRNVAPPRRRPRPHPPAELPQPELPQPTGPSPRAPRKTSSPPAGHPQRTPGTRRRNRRTVVKVLGGAVLATGVGLWAVLWAAQDTPNTPTIWRVSGGSPAIEMVSPCPSGELACPRPHAGWTWHSVAPHAVTSTTFEVTPSTTARMQHLGRQVWRTTDGCDDAVLAWTIQVDGVALAHGTLNKQTATEGIDSTFTGAARTINVTISRQDDAVCTSMFTWLDELTVRTDHP